MRPRIFIAIHYLEIGGAERSLLGLLNAIDTFGYDVDLFVYRHTGEFMSLVPKSIRLLEENRRYASIETPMSEVLRKGYVDIILARLWAKWRCRCYKRKNGLRDGSSIFQYVANAVTPLLPSLYKYGEYDLAISFLTPHNIVLDKVKAKKKIAWIHTDYSTIQVNALQELKVWGQYDYIASISEEVTNAFLKTFPSLESKIVLIENILSAVFVREQAALQDVSREMEVEKGVLKLCSVGRFSYPKNFDNIPSICRRIIENGISVKWFIVGYGGDEALIRRRIEEEGMTGRVVLLGKKANPYPYIKMCDVYVQPSRYEGKAVTVREAQILGKPVVITAFPTAQSQLCDGVDGIIVPLENELAADSIADFIADVPLRERLCEYERIHDYGNEQEVRKIYTLIEQ